MTRVEVGDPAPELTLFTSAGEEVSLADFRGNRAVVIFFYYSFVAKLRVC